MLVKGAIGVLSKNYVALMNVSELPCRRIKLHLNITKAHDVSHACSGLSKGKEIFID